ncbi:MAG: hypothetical protein FWD35_01780 [Oscillospiraceae bacterium]|nr:hypothetical protein [Oscillospiraceae bacterium]
MANKFAGGKCPVCSELFADTADVVVCPDCGLPHHRACYGELGQCINADKHAQIEQLGRALNALEEFKRIRDAQENQDSQNAQNAPNAGIHDDSKPDTVYAESPNEVRDIFGASKEELGVYMQIAHDSLEFEQRVAAPQVKVTNLNIYAGLLPPFYQFYRGMRLIGFIVLGAFVLQLYFPLLPILPLVTLLMLLFNDYVYLRHCAAKIRGLRKFYQGLPDDMRRMISYPELLKIKGKPGILRGALEAVIAFFLILIVLQRFGVGIPAILAN